MNIPNSYSGHRCWCRFWSTLLFGRLGFHDLFIRSWLVGYLLRRGRDIEVCAIELVSWSLDYEREVNVIQDGCLRQIRNHSPKTDK